MLMKSRVAAFFSLILLALLNASAEGQVVINEVMARGSDRLLKWSPTGVPKLGFGKAWNDPTFNDASWQTGVGPFGFGSFTNVSPAPVVGTNMATQMQNLTPTMYLRKSFAASAGQATSAAALSLEVQFNDGFVCYINGVEVARRNAGPVNDFKYRDSFAASGTPANTQSHLTPYLRTEVLTLPVASSVLVTGDNVIAVHALNFWENTSVHNQSTNALTSINNSNNFYFKGDLKLSGATLVANNTAWKYFPGVVEPSGGLFDPTLMFQARQSVPWGRPSFDDGLWSTGSSPFGAGSPPGGVTLGTNLTGQVTGMVTSLYARVVFTATAADVADPAALQLLMDWDDGFVAYLNGVEVARDRLEQANAFTPHNAVASSARSPGSYATYNLDPPGKLLIEGQNVLAVQVHNVSLADGDLFMRAQLRTNPAGTNRMMVPAVSTWNYFLGESEPVTAEDENIEDNPEPPEASPDWVELHNSGAVEVSLAGWGLSDDEDEPHKWSFPAGATIPAGGYLVVMCDDLDITEPAAGGFYHANFKLSADGETLVLSNAGGAAMSTVTFGAQTAAESYGRNGVGSLVFFPEPTPGAVNGGTTLSGRVAEPTFSEPGGFYLSGRTITMSCATPGAVIRYTLDGSEPTETNGVVGSSVLITASSGVRARAFVSGMIASKVATRSYLINEPVGRQSVPALCLVGDQQRSLYRPFGVMAISGGAQTNFVGPAPTGNNGMWTQTGATPGTAVDLNAYNNVVHRGRFTEKPVNMEILRADGTPGPNIEFGLRVSGSNHARPRYRLANQNRAPGASPAPNDGAWHQTDFTQKPSFNFFFRNDFGGDPLEWPLFPDYPVNAFHDVRVRAGKNDPSNPFIEDEYMRRLFISTGQVGSRGMINTLYVNGVYKGYYNLCEHVREDFLQRHHGGENAWDVRQVTVISSGDGLAFQELITYLRNNSQATLANYEGMATRLDMVNFVDYLLTNLVGVTGDWPHNNYICARERTVNGKHRYYLWDAEGAFGDFSGNVRTNMFVAGTTGSIVTTNPSGAGLGEGIRILYTLLRQSPEFRLLFADRIEKHFFNGGAFTEARMLADWNAMKAEFAPLIAPTAVNDKVTPWFNGVGNVTRYSSGGANTPSRRRVLFDGYTDEVAGVEVPAHFVAEGLWPATKAPVFGQHGGVVAPGFQLEMTNLNAGGTIHFTTDGSDPRLAGGGIAGAVYGGALTLTYPGTIKARVRLDNGEWSPLQEAYFDTGLAEPLIFTELMYHPADNGLVDGDEYEFLEIKNVGTQTVSLGGMTFSSGIEYTFPEGATLAAGSHLVIAKSISRMAERYPGVTVFDEWGASGTSLSNSGEMVTLINALDRVVFSVTYTDKAPWPTSADGGGPSLVPVSPNTVPEPDNSIYWRVSSSTHGSPGMDDPAPPALPVWVNEVMSNPGVFDMDWVELFNPNAVAVDISHWWLSDSNGTPKKYQIADGTIIPPGGYLVFDEEDFATGLVPFSISSNGERARIASADAAGNLTGYSDSHAFEASELGVTFGRFINSQGSVFFLAQKTATPGAINSGARVGPVVMSEVHYRPLSGGDEFVELRNISKQPVALYDTANPLNTWQFDGINYGFPANTVIAPGELILVVPIAPANYRTKYGVPAATRIFGPFTGGLSNSGELVALEKPGVPFLNDEAVTEVPWIRVDQVTFGVSSPWPTAANGTGPSLEKLDLAMVGEEPLNWRASPVNGGSLGIPASMTLVQWQALYFTPAQVANALIGGANADPDGDGLTNFQEWAHGFDPLTRDANPVTFDVKSDNGEDYLCVEVVRSRSAVGVSWFGDTSVDLLDWNLGAGVQLGSPEVHADGTESVTFRHTIPMSSTEPRGFLRARVVGP